MRLKICERSLADHDVKHLHTITFVLRCEANREYKREQLLG